MKSLLLLLFALSPTLLSAQPTDAAGPPMIISTGAEGGGYWGLGSRLALAATQYKGVVDVRTSSGSIENLKRLHDDEDFTALGLTQADALAVFLEQEPTFASRFEVLETIGKECVFVVAAQDSGIDEFSDLTGNVRVAVPSETSGVAVTFRALQSMQPHLAEVEAVYLSPEQAMAELAEPPGEGKVDALMLVHRPKLRSDALKKALYEPEQFHLVPIDDDTLDDRKLPNGRPVYTAMNLPLLREGWTAKVSLQTVCTEGLLLTMPEKLDPAQSRALKRVVDYDWMRVYAEPAR